MTASGSQASAASGPWSMGEPATPAAASAPADSVPGPDAARDDPLPRPPEEPDPGDCCGEGCVRCIYDVHDEAVERYRAALAAWQERHPEQPPPD